ncbi:Hypothetical protein POVR1_LOCUS338 [uncultured virus]|nr:Hypothetical protein POVR1_LOCUS338 [uncultured virus]
MDQTILDPILQRQDLLTFVRLYLVSKETKALIDENLEKIQRVLKLRGQLGSFRGVVEAYEESIVDLLFNVGLLRALDYSPKLMERVIKEHPVPFNYTRACRESDSYFFGADQKKKKVTLSIQESWIKFYSFG